MASSDLPLRVGLLGYGLAGEVFHAPLIAATPGLELGVVVTSDPERAARAAAAHPGAEVTADADAVWATDVVVVATPNRFHSSYAHEAIARGVPVVVDKPLATSLHEVETLLTDLEAAAGKLTAIEPKISCLPTLKCKILIGTIFTETRELYP